MDAVPVILGDGDGEGHFDCGAEVKLKLPMRGYKNVFQCLLTKIGSSEALCKQRGVEVETRLYSYAEADQAAIRTTARRYENNNMRNGKQGKNCCCLRRLREHHFTCSQR